MPFKYPLGFEMMASKTVREEYAVEGCPAWGNSERSKQLAVKAHFGHSFLPRGFVTPFACL